MRQKWPKPVLGLAGYSGSGKTSLLCQLLPLLKQRDLRVSVIKHSHHEILLDKPGKDSHRLFNSGANEVILACPQQRYHFSQQHQSEQLEQQLQWVQWQQCDLVLVEGYRESNIDKIEVHRPALGKALLYPNDPNIIALSCNEALNAPLPVLDLNQASQVLDFIIDYLSQISE
ncbi:MULTISPECIES: molybdopterin-guanine dinucleotide biosynthesis protein B [unclassified Agarivorans]|uniref:molybdopterin-guanine dinucleotide biosynthesis protein B n=1 Tax=unclassified Agarivorans TaxID=2636026 RepID=UPI003D7DB267